MSSNGTTDSRPMIQDFALAALFLSPLIAALPPRKFDLYTMCLGGGGGYSAYFLYFEGQEGRLHRNLKLPFIRNVSAEERLQRQAEAQKAQEARALAQRQNQAIRMQERPMTGRERTAEEDRKKLEEGKGLQGIIVDQIWEVWNQGKADDGKKKP